VLPELVVITDWALPRARLLSAIEALGALGPRVAIQHRHPGASVLQLLQEARVLARLCERARLPLFVNGRIDVALRVSAHLHLPSRGILPADARPFLPKDRWISAAVHDGPELTDAAGADLLLVSPIFKPSSKEDSRPPLGVSGLEALAGGTAARVYALGGIGPGSAATVPPRFGLAAIGAVLHAPDPLRAAQALLRTRR
jgi:thiamine-phosphate pyrophosphorylase